MRLSVSGLLPALLINTHGLSPALASKVPPSQKIGIEAISCVRGQSVGDTFMGQVVGQIRAAAKDFTPYVTSHEPSYFDPKKVVPTVHLPSPGKVQTEKSLISVFPFEIRDSTDPNFRGLHLGASGLCSTFFSTEPGQQFLGIPHPYMGTKPIKGPDSRQLWWDFLTNPPKPRILLGI
ncbi:MAG: hypothetical protein ACK551_07775 [Vampirovibrionales bacterium]